MGVPSVPSEDASFVIVRAGCLVVVIFSLLLLLLCDSSSLVSFVAVCSHVLYSSKNVLMLMY